MKFRNAEKPFSEAEFTAASVCNYLQADIWSWQIKLKVNDK